MNTRKTSVGSLNAANVIRCIILVVAACLVHGTMQGVHDNYGIMMNGLLEPTGISYANISFCIGVGAMLYGLAQPFLGMLALRKSNAFVLMLGVIMTIAGLVLTPLCRSFPALLICFGILLPLGTTGLCFGIVMGAITPIIGEERAAWVSGIVQASAGVGDAIMSPGLQAMIAARGIRFAMSILSFPFLIMIPVVIWIGALNRNNPVASAAAEEEARESLTGMLKNAFRDRNYRLILIGFATCGFNMSIIESHLFSQYLSYGISGQAASFALTVYGIATFFGAILAGFLGTKFKTKNVLGTVYAIRIFISLGFLFLPKTVAFAFTATALLGMSGDATVPPTTSIVSRRFGARKMAVLYGFACIGHQIGAFASSWLGGIFVENGLGYAPLWVINMILALIASTASYMIREDGRARAV